LGERIGGTLHVAGIELLAESDLVGGEPFFSHDSGPGSCGVAAAREFLVDLFVAGAAIARSHLSGDYEAVVILFLLTLRGLVAVEAGNAFPGVLAHLKFMNDGILLMRMAFRAFAGGHDELRVGLVHLNAGPSPLDEESTKNQSEGDDEGDEHISKRHYVLRCGSGPAEREGFARGRLQE